MKAATVQDWMGKLKVLRDRYNFPPKLILNFDETMLDASGHKVKVLVCAQDPCLFTENEAKLKHITLGLYISAAGGFICPLLILPLKNLPAVDPKVQAFYSFAGQTNGFIDNAIWHNWVKDEIVPYVTQIHLSLNKPTQPALLIVDSHSTRKHQPTILLFTDHNIIVLILPAHSSTILQPLDLIVNGELKCLLKLRFKPKKSEYGPIKHNKLLYTTVDCLQGVFLAMHITDGFFRAGIYPFSEEAPLNSKVSKWLERLHPTS